MAKKNKKKTKNPRRFDGLTDFLESPGAQFFRGKAHKINLVKLPRRHKAWMKWTAWIYKMSKLCWNTSCSNKPRCIHSSNGSRLPKHSWQKRIDGLSVELGPQQVEKVKLARDLKHEVSPQMVASLVRVPSPAISRKSDGWWNIIPFGHINGIGIFT